MSGKIFGGEVRGKYFPAPSRASSLIETDLGEQFGEARIGADGVG
jgi:hypothetical protein